MKSKFTSVRNRLVATKRMAFSRRRRGVTLVVVLAALVIVAGVLLPLIPSALRARRQVELEEVALQNEFLKNAVTQHLAIIAPLESISDEELTKLSGQVRFGPEDSLQGDWFVRRNEPGENAGRELKITVRLEFKESPESGVSPWMTPKSETDFLFPLENKNESQP